MHFELTKIEGNVVHGLVHGLHNEADAHRYMSSPPSMPCSEILCPVQSWIAKSGGDIPGAAVGDWAVALRVKDRSLLDGLLSGHREIEVEKNQKGLIEFNIVKKGLVQKSGTKHITTTGDDRVCSMCKKAESDGEIPIDQPYSNGKMHPPFHGETCRCRETISKAQSELNEFNINNTKKCMKVNKKMSKPSAAEQIDNLATGLIAKSNGSLDPVAARIQIRKQHPELAAKESEEYRALQFARSGIVQKEDDATEEEKKKKDDEDEDEEDAAAEVEKRAAALVEKGATGIKDISMARNEVRKQSPELARREALQERAIHGFV